MLLLLNHENAYTEDSKFFDYLLNEGHPVGKHKAIVFKKVLGVTLSNYNVLKERILKGIINYPALEGMSDVYGIRYIVDFPWRENDSNVIIRTAWIIRVRENFPRLVTVFIL